MVTKECSVTISFDAAACQNAETAMTTEWLSTNGLGGYASGTIAGANTRKYHGLLVVAAYPPVQRYVVLSRAEDRLLLPTPDAAGNTVIDLSTNEFADIIHPQGYQHITAFDLAEGPLWRYQIGDLILEKTITLIHGQDTVIVRYVLLPSTKKSATPTAPVKLQLQPMLAGRDFHATIQGDHRPSWNVAQQDTTLALEAPQCPVKLFITHNADRFNLNACWWYNFTYRMERQRGYPDHEDLWTPGMLEYTLTPGVPVGFIASTAVVPWTDHPQLLAAAKERHTKFAHGFAKTDPEDEFLSTLSLAADQFVVQRGVTSDKKSVIAGYPWFEDWGRDTFISLPGLALVTGRHEIAKSILSTFADHMRRGLLPNRFPDKAFTPDYNTVDASMWFVHAAYAYWRYTGDSAFLTKYLYPKLCEIMESYRDGTDFGIRMDADGLIRAGDGNHQPTWMDAKIGDWVVTPRHGKPVEINALWYSNLRIMALVAKGAGDATRAATFAALAQRVQAIYEKTYWNDSANCLFDVISDDGTKDPSIRPNQLIAVSLPFSPLTEEAQLGIVAVCQKLLLTPMGMRTLAPGSHDYHGRCAGDQRNRDMAYHQGTVWPWLIGPFITAYVKVRGETDAARKEAAAFIEPFKDHLRKAGLGSVSEIADGDAPFTPRGCPAQAWSVAEILRVHWEDLLNRAPAWPHLAKK
jgi:predicted glycogen debranching enzyme